MDELLSEWGGNIERGRVARGLTQSELAELCQVAQSTVSKWESGAMVPSDTNKVEIAAALRRPARALFPLTRGAVRA